MAKRLILFIVLLLVPGFAFATEGIDVTPVITQVTNIAVLALTIAAGFITKFVINWLANKAKIEDENLKILAAERVNTILYHAIQYTEAYIKNEIQKDDNPLKNVKIDNFFIRTAANYALNKMSGEGGLLKFFNLTEDEIKAMILTRLNDRINVKTEKIQE